MTEDQLANAWGEAMVNGAISLSEETVAALKKACPPIEGTPEQTEALLSRLRIVKTRFPAEEGLALCPGCESILIAGETDDGMCMGCADG